MDDTSVSGVSPGSEGVEIDDVPWYREERRSLSPPPSSIPEGSRKWGTVGGFGLDLGGRRFGFAQKGAVGDDGLLNGLAEVLP